MKDFNRICSGFNNKFSQLNIANTKLKAKYSTEVKSLKSNIKTLKRELTLAQKASSSDKVQILSLETKIHELEGKLKDIDLERTYHDLDVIGGVIEKLAQISSSESKEIDSLRLELERANKDLNSKRHEIEYMKKGIESSNSIFRREIDALHSARSKLREENRSFRDQLELKENNEISFPPPPMNDSSQIISAGGAEIVSLLTTAPILVSSLLSPIIIYSILTLLLIAIIWLVVGKRLWNLWKKSNTDYSPNQNYFLSSPGISKAGLYDRRPEVQR